MADPLIDRNSNSRFPVFPRLVLSRPEVVAGLFACAIGALGCLGWWFGWPSLTSWIDGFATLKPVTALCFVALGLALLVDTGPADDLARAGAPAPNGDHGKSGGRGAAWSFRIGVAVAAIAALELAENVVGTDVGLEGLLVTHGATPGPGATSLRMTAVSAIALLLTGAALALSTQRRHHAVAATLAVAAGAVAVFAPLGYAAGVDELYRFVPFGSPALLFVIGVLTVAAVLIKRTVIDAGPAVPRPLWHYLVLFGLATVAPLLLFGLYTGVRIADAEQAQIRQQLLQAARTLSAAVDREIIGEIETMQGLAASPSLAQGDLAAFQRQARAALAVRHSGAVILFDTGLDRLVDTLRPIGSPPPRSAVDGEAAARRAIDTRQPQVSSLFDSPAGDHELAFEIYVPVTIDGAVRYVIARSPRLSSLASLVASHELPEGWRAAISDAANRIIARKPENDLFVGRYVPAATTLETSRAKGLAGVVETTDREGRSVEQAYVWSDLTGWRSSVAVATTLLERPIRAVWRGVMLLSLLTLALVATLGSWVSRTIAGSFRAAARDVEGIAAAAPLPPVMTPIAEANALACALADAVTRRRDAEGERGRLEQLIAHSTDFVSLADESGALTFLNPAGRRLIGLSDDADLAGLRLADYVAPSSLDLVRNVVIPTARDIGNWEGELQLVNVRTGALVDVRHSMFALRDRADALAAYASVARDVTDSNRFQHRLTAAYDTFRHLVTNSPFGIYVVDADLRMVQVSAGARKAFANVNPLIGRDFDEIMHTLWPHRFASEAIARFRHTLATGEPYQSADLIEQRKDIGEIEAYDWRIERLVLPDGRYGVVCNFYDLSERQRYEAALRDSEEMFRAMFSISSVGKAWTDPATGRYLRVNAALCGMTGYSEEELLSMTFFDMTHPDDLSDSRELMRRRNEEGSDTKDHEKRFVRKDGSIWWAHVTANVVHDEHGSPSRVTAVVLDISDRKHAEDELRASEERFRTIVTTAQEGIWSIDRVGVTTLVNPRLAEMLGTTVDAMVGKSVNDFFFPDDIAAWLEHVAANFAGRSEQFEFRFRRADGSALPVLAATTPLRGKQGQIVGALAGVVDLSQRKRAEERQQVMMRELAHRGKNLLAVIQSIANRTFANAATIDGALESFTGRLQALAHSYGSLTDEAFEGAPLYDLAAAELSMFGARARLNGPRIMLTAKVAQMFALVLHELATNAAKYGALSVPNGQLQVNWRITGSDGEQRFVFDWRELGPPAAAPSRRGFGTQLITLVAGTELKCAPELTYDERGLRYRLEAPLAVVGAPLAELPIRHKLQSAMLTAFYDAWSSAKDTDEMPRMRAFNRERFAATGGLTVAAVDGGDIRFLEVGRELTERLCRPIGPSDLAVESEYSTKEAYRRCVRNAQPCYDQMRFDFGDGEVINFERLLLPFSLGGKRVTHVAGLVVFSGEDRERSPRPTGGKGSAPVASTPAR